MWREDAMQISQLKAVFNIKKVQYPKMKHVTKNKPKANKTSVHALIHERGETGMQTRLLPVRSLLRQGRGMVAWSRQGARLLEKRKWLINPRTEMKHEISQSANIKIRENQCWSNKVKASSTTIFLDKLHKWSKCFILFKGHIQYKKLCCISYALHYQVKSL